MVRRRNREKKPSKTVSEFKVILEPVFLPEAENKQRIKELAALLLECFANAKRTCKEAKRSIRKASGILEVNHDEIFGLT